MALSKAERNGFFQGILLALAIVGGGGAVIWWIITLVIHP